MGRKYAMAIIFLLSSLAAIGCTGYQASGDGTPIGIAVDRQNYTPLLSSTVGIGLTPEYPTAIGNDTVIFRWQTNYGYFISWKAPDFKVQEMGPDVTTGDRKVYWSYSPEDMEKEKPPVHVTLTMVNKTTGKATNTTGLDIVWDNKSWAKVKK